MFKNHVRLLKMSSTPNPQSFDTIESETNDVTRSDFSLHTEDQGVAQSNCIPEDIDVIQDRSSTLNVQPSDSHVPGTCCSSSSHSSTCRICQLSGEESAESLETSRCSCKGSLAKVHRQCLERWVQYRGSNLCEICGSRFVAVTNPAPLMAAGPLEALLPTPSPPDTFYFQTLETIRLQLMQVAPINRRKRTAMAGFLVFLLLVTGVTAVLTVGADEDFQRANRNPWVTEADLRKTHVVFSICLSFLFFCITLTVGLTFMWIVVELYFYLRRRRIFREAAQRLVNNAPDT